MRLANRRSAGEYERDDADPCGEEQHPRAAHHHPDAEVRTGDEHDKQPRVVAPRGQRVVQRRRERAHEHRVGGERQRVRAIDRVSVAVGVTLVEIAANSGALAT